MHVNHNNKNNKQLLSAIPVLGTIGFSISPAKVPTTNVFAQNDGESDVPRPETRPIDPLTDLEPDLKFDGKTEGWAIIAGQAFESKIGLEGVAGHIDEGVWKIKSEGKIQVEKRNATLDLKGKAIDNKIRLSGSGVLENGEVFRLILRGIYAPVYDEENTFALVFSTAAFHNLDTGIKIPLMQVCKVHVEAVNSAVVEPFETNLEILS